MSLPITNRLLITGGPGSVLFNGKTVFSQDPIALESGVSTVDVQSDAFGPLDARYDDKQFRLRFKPVGEWEDLSMLYPYLNTPVGTLLFGADVPLHVLSLTDNKVTTFHAAALSKMPNLVLGVKETMLEEVQFSMLTKNLTEATDANSLFQEYDLVSAIFTLTYSTPTGNLIFTSTSAQIEAALNALAAIISDGGVTVTGDHRQGYTVTWVTVGARATGMTGAAGLGFPVGTASSVSVTVITVGDATHKEVRLIKVQPWCDMYGGALGVTTIKTQPYELRWISAGTFTVTYGANTTGALAYNITAADLSTALNVLASIISAGGVTVTGSIQDDWVVTFVTTGARTAFSGVTTGMPPNTVVAVRETTTGSATAASVQRLKLSPWASFGSMDGVRVTFDDKYDPRVTQVDGTSNYRFMGYGVKAELIPDGIGLADIMAALKVQSTGSVRGRSMNSGSQNLDIVGVDNLTFIRIYGANVIDASGVWGLNADRVGRIAFQSSRVINAGVINPLAYVGVAPLSP